MIDEQTSRIGTSGASPSGAFLSSPSVQDTTSTGALSSGISASRLLGVLTVLVVVTGCPGRGGNSTTAKSKQQNQVQSFSDASPIRLLVGARPYIFSASESGLDRWDLKTGESLLLDEDHGLSGKRVLTMAFDSSRSWLWVATDGGVTRYNVEKGTFESLPKPPSVLGLDSFRGAKLASASDGGLWVAHKRGLFYAKSNGQWTATGITEPVSAVMQSRNGWLWFGTETGLIGRRPDGESFNFGPNEGCDIVDIKMLAEAPGGAPMIIGDNENGEQRIALILNDACATYRFSEDKRFLATARRAKDLVMMTDSGLYMLAMANSGHASLSKANGQLVPAPSGGRKPPPATPYTLYGLDIAIPARPMSLAVLDDEIFVGTRFLGAVRLNIERGKQSGWLRRGDIVENASVLTVACREKNDCFVGTNGTYAWHYNGDKFKRVEIPGTRVQGFVRTEKGAVFALVSRIDENTIVAYRYTNGKWVSEPGVRIEAKEGAIQLRCARLSPGNLLWVGMEYRDEDGEWRSHGTAVADLELGITVYHRESASVADIAGGVIPIPIGVVDLAFLAKEEVWLATTQGAARVRGTEVRVFSEADGLESEFLRGIAISHSGEVYAASGRGVAEFDGKQWLLPKALDEPTNDIEIGIDGRLWLATDNGVTVYDGLQVNRLDKKRGLLQAELEEIRADHYGRLWVRGTNGITIITP